MTRQGARVPGKTAPQNGKVEVAQELTMTEMTALMAVEQFEQNLQQRLQETMMQKGRIIGEVEQRLGLEPGSLSSTHGIDMSVDPWVVVLNPHL